MMPSKLDAAAALESMDSLDAMQGCVPAFDFSALGELSGQATEADQQFNLHYGTAQDEYLISCIYVSKIHSLTARAGRYGGGTWTKWYESKGLSEGSARTMVKNGDAFKSATVADLKCLPELTRRDLNLIARSGHADQFVAVAGDSQRVKELLEQLKAEQERADTAEAERDAAIADVKGLDNEVRQRDQTIHELVERSEEADARAEKAEARAKEAGDKLNELDEHLAAALADVQGLSERNEKLLDERDEYIRTIRQLETRPVEVMKPDADEIDRLAAERAVGLASARNAELADENTALKEQLDALQEFVTDVSQDDFATAYHFVDSTKEAFMLMIPVILRLMEKDRGQVCRDLVDLLSWMSAKTIILADGEDPRSVEYYDPDEDEDEWEEDEDDE